MSKSVRHWRTGAIRWWHTAIAAGGVGTARSERVVDTLRCIINLIWGPNDWFQMMIFVLFWENNLAFFPLCFGVQGCLAVVHCHCGEGLGAAQGPQKPEGSRCSEMHSQPYLSPKWIIPDGNSSCFEKTIYPFYLFMVCRADCGTLPLRPGVWGLLKAPRSQRVPDALRCILSHIWALNELFQMEFLPVLRKQFTLLPFHGVQGWLWHTAIAAGGLGQGLSQDPSYLSFGQVVSWKPVWTG